MEELQSACVAGLKASYSETGVHYEQNALRETSRENLGLTREKGEMSLKYPRRRCEGECRI